MRRALGFSLAAALGACAGDSPYRTTFDASAGEVTVTVFGDGFVRSGGEREPLEALVLTLRQRTRAMTQDERHRFVVHLEAEPQRNDDATRSRVAADLDRLLAELQIMGVRQVRYL